MKKTGNQTTLSEHIQAPIRPSKARTISTKPPKSSTIATQRPRSLDDPYAIPRLRNKAPTKAHKRSFKQATLLSRLQRTAPGSKVTKRRRPSKKLVTGLRDLEDALPDATGNARESQGGEKVAGKIKQKSLKSRPGAMKRMEKLMTAERERFAKNLALMAAGSNEHVKGERFSKPGESERLESAAGTETKSGSSARWAAIRDHIGRTMEMMDHKGSN